jgi:hypothetical protein
MLTTATQHHWEVIAHSWRHVGAPLRPCPQDCANFANLVGLPNREPLDILILGVTPELFHLSWPAGSTVRAVDRSMEMIRVIWPGSPASACHADWLAMPFPPGSFDCVLCDGGLHLLEGPALQRSLSAVVSGVLKLGGQFIVRLFAQSALPEDPHQIFSDLKAGNIPNLHIFKLRLAMALQESFETGIVLNEVYDRIISELGSFMKSSLRPTGPERKSRR